MRVYEIYSGVVDVGRPSAGLGGWSLFGGGVMGNVFCKGVNSAKDEYNEQAARLETKIGALEKRFNDLKKGSQQRDISNLIQEYVALSAEIINLNEQLERESTKTAAWEKSPESFYDEYKGNKVGLGCALGVTACDTASRDAAERRKNNALARVKELEAVLDVLEKMHKEDTKHFRDVIKVKKTVKDLKIKQINDLKSKQQGIMLAFEERKKEEEKALARERELKEREDALNKQNAQQKAEQEKKAEGNTTVYIVGGAVILAICLAFKGGNKTKVKVKM